MDELISSRASSAPQPDGNLVSADELPDGVVVADEAGRIVVFNRVAARLTGLDPAEVTGKFVFDVLPLRDAEGRDWWVYADPYDGLPTRTRHPERSLFLADGTEILVSIGYVREERAKGGDPGPAAPGRSRNLSSACAARSSGSASSAAAPSWSPPSPMSCVPR